MRTFVMAAVFGLAAGAVSAPGYARAEGLVFSKASASPISSRTTQFRNQVSLLDTRLSGQYGASTQLRPDADRITLSVPGVIPRYRGSYKGQYLVSAKAAAARHNVPEDLFLRLVQTESGWNPSAVSPKGAQGLAQLMPGTAQLLGVSNPMDPQQNLEGGARYLRMMYERFGDWRLALAAYNAGPMAVDKHGDIPPFVETQNYVVAIFGS